MMRYDQRDPIVQPPMIEIAHWLYLVMDFPTGWVTGNKKRWAKQASMKCPFRSTSTSITRVAKLF